MSLFQLPTKEIHVQLRLEGGEVLAGQFFLSEHGPDGGPGLLSQRLNDDSERFLPLAVNGRVYLVQKSRIASIRVEGGADEFPVPGGEAVTRVAVGVSMTHGLTIEGRTCYTMPRERERLVDFLNSAPTFVLLQQEEASMLINRDQIVSVWSLNPADE